MALLTRRRAGRPGGRLAWCALLGGVGASLAANVAAAEPTATARVVAAWPALAFAVAFELLLQQRRVPVVEPAVGDPPSPDPVVGGPGGVDEPAAPAGATAVEPALEVDPLGTAVAELVGAAHAQGRPVGRRTVARELGVTEYRAGQLLARTNTNGDGRNTP